MAYNLCAPGNEQAAFVAECQKRASFWLWQWRKGRIGRGEIDRKLNALTENEQTETRKWLNHYREQQ
ncbi:hypothetical protein AU461_23205 [Vibrio parahaemolyticus]|uniref:hypothetical protein n=1 Tax=Vibrio parahaemolyticus TaxID=670 RepID=UPI000789ACD3|nr:hypothetical protein [Vibrio parahaemolyticus]KYO58427.1 hypothetical protein AU461_23205 [Vibrio parahaemolyticus]KYX47750.1 hypothetical protein AU389_02105 [Vibrio parahaemolyticus]